MEKLKEKFPEIIENIEVSPDNKTNFIINKNGLIALVKFIKENKDFDFNYLSCISGVDYLEYLQVVYHFFSTKFKKWLVLKINLNKENPEVESLANIFPTADWQEREIYDLYGVIFLNHPDLRRILLPDDWEGHPLRKDYQVPDFKILTEKYKE